MTSLSTHTNAASSEQTCSGLDAIVAAYDSDEDTRAPSSTERPLSCPLPPKTGTHKDRMQKLRDVWTFNALIEKLDSIKKRVSSRCKTVDTSFSANDKTLFVQVLDKIDSKSTQHALTEKDQRLL